MSEHGPLSHDIAMRPKYLIQVSLGLKTVESRADTPTMQEIQEGDNVCFFASSNHDLYVHCDITGRFEYPTVEEMLAIEGVDAVLPGIGSPKSAITIFEETPNYRALEAEYGVVALLLEPTEISRSLLSRRT